LTHPRTSIVVQVFLTYGASHQTNHNTSCLCLKTPTNQKTTQVKWTEHKSHKSNNQFNK